MPNNASRRGATDMGMPLMILAFAVIGGFLYWLNGQAAAEREMRVVEETSEEEEAAPTSSGTSLAELTVVGVNLDEYEGDEVMGEGFEVASRLGTEGFWVNTESGNPFLIAFSEELRAAGITVQQGDIVTVHGELLRMEVTYLDEWLAEGTISETDKIVAEFATHFVMADEVTVGGGAGDGSGNEGDEGEGAGG